MSSLYGTFAGRLCQVIFVRSLNWTENGKQTQPKKPISWIRMENKISIIPEVCNGRPVITGTRIFVQTVLEFLGAGDSIEDILEEYPSLTKEDVYAP